jgi:hypothetical protein
MKSLFIPPVLLLALSVPALAQNSQGRAATIRAATIRAEGTALQVLSWVQAFRCF